MASAGCGQHRRAKSRKLRTHQQPDLLQAAGDASVVATFLGSASGQTIEGAEADQMKMPSMGGQASGQTRPSVPRIADPPRSAKSTSSTSIPLVRPPEKPLTRVEVTLKIR